MDATAADSAKEVVLLVHGIRTRANWQERVAATLERECGVVAVPLRYGYFDVFRFWFPLFTRKRVIERVAREVRAALASHPGARISILAHSYGTYSVGTILAENPDIRLHRLVLCGSILPLDYRWDRIAHQIERKPVNECGTRDCWPVLARTSTWGYGPSGTFGFGSAHVHDRFHDIGHSDAFEGDFVAKYVVPVFRGDEFRRSEWDQSRPPVSLWMSLLGAIPLRYGLLVAFLAIPGILVWKALPDGLRLVKVKVREPGDRTHLGDRKVHVAGSLEGAIEGAIVTVNGQAAEVERSGRFAANLIAERDGDLPLDVKVDGEGIQSAQAQVVVTVDTTAPKIVVESPSAGEHRTLDAQATLSGRVEDLSPVTVTATVDGQPIANPAVKGGKFSLQVPLTAGVRREVVLQAKDSLGHSADPVRRALLQLRPWDEALEAAKAAAASEDWRTARDCLAKAIAAGAPASEVPSLLEKGIQRWEAKPALVVDCPKSVSGLKVAVKGTLTDARKSDAVFVHGKKVSTGNGAFSTEITASGLGNRHMFVEVKDGEEIRCEPVKCITEFKFPEDRFDKVLHAGSNGFEKLLKGTPRRDSQGGLEWDVPADLALMEGAGQYTFQKRYDSDTIVYWAEFEVREAEMEVQWTVFCTGIEKALEAHGWSFGDRTHFGSSKYQASWSVRRGAFRTDLTVSLWGALKRIRISIDL